jgi:hypothetical protein
MPARGEGLREAAERFNARVGPASSAGSGSGTAPA